MSELENKVVSANEQTDLFDFANKDKSIHDTKFETKPISYLQDCLRRFVKNKASVAAFFIILLIALFAIFEPIFDSKYQNNTVLQYNYFDRVLPKLSIFEGTGFWDGTKKEGIGENEYNLNRFTDSNYDKYVRLESVEEVRTGFTTQMTYNVVIDTYAVGTRLIQISESEYNALVEYDENQPEDHKIIKPQVDYTSYLNEYRQQLLDNGASSQVATQIYNNMLQTYSTNAQYYFALECNQRSDGSYIDTSFSPIYTEYDADGVGTDVQDIYLRDESGNLIYYTVSNGRYNVRVDYHDYFTYYYGYEPVFAFGTNQFGQDICLRMALGCRFSLLLGIGITVINFLIGLVWGAISGYYGGTLDLVLERITDIISGIPTIIIMTICNIQFNNNIGLNNAVGPMGVIVLAILVAFVYNGWVGTAATTRMQFYRFKGQEYVLASLTLGARDGRLIFKHILPNAAGTLVTSSVLMVPSVIFSESSLSYLGIIDFTSSSIVSLGAMVSEGQQANIAFYPHVILFPAIVISLLMISFNLFGNGLRDAFNTTLRGSEE